MQHSVVQSTVGVKVEGVAWAWGFEAALKSESLYKGYYFFCGARFLEWERGYLAGVDLAARIHQRVMAEVKAAMPGAPADLIAGVADVELGASYCKPGIDWAAVEADRIGD